MPLGRLPVFEWIQAVPAFASIRHPQSICVIKLSLQLRALVDGHCSHIKHGSRHFLAGLQVKRQAVSAHAAFGREALAAVNSGPPPNKSSRLVAAVVITWPG